ncbi:unnamed protein product [Symbiodinium sp. CCMP2592]|nr:unnamed protein product [Symbiodinium sp. CCMP2592]
MAGFFAVLASVLAVAETCNMPTSVTGVLSDGTNIVNARDVAVSGSYAYVVSTGIDGLLVVDISDPTSPTVATSLVDSTDMAAPEAVKVVGNYAYVIGYTSDSLAIVDVSNPTSITKVGSLNTSPSGDMNGAHGLDVVGNYAYVVSRLKSSLTIIDVTDKTNPTYPSGLPMGRQRADDLASGCRRLRQLCLPDGKLAILCHCGGRERSHHTCRRWRCAGHHEYGRCLGNCCGGKHCLCHCPKWRQHRVS